MNRTVATWVMFIVPLALGLFYVKHVVENLEDELTKIENNIASDEEEIHVLKAEWAYLSRPERIKNFASKYLQLVPTESQQIADVNSIPLKNAEATHVAFLQY